tara:strand:+ start:1973 stop:2188 length:216 start_codon:yes stop_codon:yes gene_type:complete
VSSKEKRVAFLLEKEALSYSAIWCGSTPNTIKPIPETTPMTSGFLPNKQVEEPMDPQCHFLGERMNTETRR